jgi:hypothetical protein
MTSTATIATDTDLNLWVERRIEKFVEAKNDVWELVAPGDQRCFWYDNRNPTLYKVLGNIGAMPPSPLLPKRAEVPDVSLSLKSFLAKVLHHKDIKSRVDDYCRGIPVNASMYYSDEVLAFAHAGYAHSWISLGELLEYDWDFIFQDAQSFLDAVVAELDALASKHRLTFEDLRIVFFFST